MSLTNLDSGSGTYGADEAGVDNVVSRMEDAITTLRTSLNKINDSVQGSKSSWEGDARVQFEKVATEWDDEVTRLNGKLDELTAAVNAGKGAIVEADSQGLA